MQKTKLAIIGSGPAGYTAAIYTSRAKLSPTIFTGLESGGQLMYTSELENFPGFPKGVNGIQFMMSLRKQAERFNAQIIDNHVTAVDFSQKPFKLWTKVPEGEDIQIFKKGKPEEIETLINKVKALPHDYEAEAIIISTGATAITSGVPGEKKFLGRGVSTCAVCDAAFYKEKDVFVIGGGDSAMEDAMALTKFAKQVTIIHRRDKFRASKVMQDRVLNNEKIKVLWNSNIKEVIGDKIVEKIKVETAGKVNGEAREGALGYKVNEYPAGGVFLAIGHRPVTNIFQNQLLLDDHGYIITRLTLSKTGLEQAQKALNEAGFIQSPTMTSVDGIFACGDVVDLRYKQAVTAAGQGAAAALDAEKWLDEEH